MTELRDKSAFDMALSLDPNIPITTAADALKQWGEAQREAGRREIEEAACRRGRHVARRPRGCACGRMPPLNLRANDDEWTTNDDPAPESGVKPNVFERIEQGGFPKVEQPSSLVEQVEPIVMDHMIPVEDRLRSITQAFAEAIDALTAEAQAQVTTDDRIFRRLNALTARVLDVEWRAAATETRLELLEANTSAARSAAPPPDLGWSD